MSDGQSYFKIKGVSPDQEIITNDQGGTQSKAEYSFDEIPAEVLFDIAETFAEGERKYKKHTWKKIPSKDHLNHMLIHLYADMLGDKQEEHLKHFICRAVMFYYMQLKERE